MKPFDLEDIESVAYVDKDNNDVIIYIYMGLEDSLIHTHIRLLPDHQ